MPQLGKSYFRTGKILHVMTALTSHGAFVTTSLRWQQKCSREFSKSQPRRSHVE